MSGPRCGISLTCCANTSIASFFLASHPRPVREAIERYRKELDHEPLHIVEQALFQTLRESMPQKVKKAAAEYLGAKPEEIASLQIQRQD